MRYNSRCTVTKDKDITCVIDRILNKEKEVFLRDYKFPTNEYVSI